MTLKKKQMPAEDPIVAEVRATKEKLAAKFGNDIASMLKDAQKRQASDGRRVLKLTQH